MAEESPREEERVPVQVRVQRALVERIDSWPCDLGLLLRQVIGVGTPRGPAGGLQGRVAAGVWALIGLFVGLWIGLERLLTRFRPDSARITALSRRRPPSTGHLNIGDFYLGLIRNGTRMARLRRTTFVLFVGGILAYGAAFAGYMLNRFDLVNLIRDVNADDSFYYFQVASRMAAGEFSTFDGITRTNGYHPLWLFLITPFYWVLDKTAALFAIKSFEIMLIAGGVVLVTAAARVARLPWVLLFAVLPAI